MKSIDLNQIDAFIFDFDGVLTNNKVFVDTNGNETVLCSRADGLAFDALRVLNKPCFILSTEKNKVVEERAKKLKVEVLQGLKNKVKSLEKLVIDKKYKKSKIFYVGNDLNDFLVMKECGYTACPSDSHTKIKSVSTYKCISKGGEGVVREILEEIFKIDFIEVLYK
tara:strand:- start:700 stop:1200 length:501 start_codon:yes stop_codon:yes gene_type:complete